ncbi:unnamed protein product [Ectocarpus sp. 4 AP-2014]
MAGRVAMAILLVASGATAAAAAGGAERRAEVVNTQVQRKIDVSTQFAKVVTTYTVKGTSGSYKFALPADAQDHLAFMSVTMDKAELEFELDAPSPGRDGAGEGLVLYSAVVERPQNKEEVKIAVGAVVQVLPYFVRCCLLRHNTRPLRRGVQ